MLFIDPREGSRELIEPLKQLGIPVEKKQLSAGDLMFVGRGEKGEPLSIAIEFKKMSDLVQSLNDGRLLGNTLELKGQVPRMVERYDRNWLVIEGDWDRDSAGKVSTWKGRVKKPLKGAPHAMELRKRVLVADLRWGIRHVYTKNRRDTLDTIFALYRVWTDKDLDEHKSHLAIHAPDHDSLLRLPMSNFRGGLKVWLPGVGFSASKTIEDWVTRWVASERKALPLPYLLMEKSLKEWAELELPDRRGNKKKLGEKRAQEIMRELGTWYRSRKS